MEKMFDRVLRSSDQIPSKWPVGFGAVEPGEDGGHFVACVLGDPAHDRPHRRAGLVGGGVQVAGEHRLGGVVEELVLAVGAGVGGGARSGQVEGGGERALPGRRQGERRPARSGPAAAAGQAVERRRRRASAPSRPPRGLSDVGGVEQPVVTGKGRPPADRVRDDVVFDAERDHGEVVGLEDRRHRQPGRLVGLGGADDEGAVAFLDGQRAGRGAGRAARRRSRSEGPGGRGASPIRRAARRCLIRTTAHVATPTRTASTTPAMLHHTTGPGSVDCGRGRVAGSGVAGMPRERDERPAVVEPARLDPAAAGGRSADDRRRRSRRVEQRRRRRRRRG